MSGLIKVSGTLKVGVMPNALDWASKKNLKYIMLSNLEQLLKTSDLRQEPDRSTIMTLQSLKTLELVILSNSSLMPKFLLSLATLTTSSSWPVMLSQFFLPYPSSPLSKLSTTSIQDTLLKLQELSKESRSLPPPSLPASVRPSYPWNHRFTLTSFTRRSSSITSMFGLSTLDGLEESMELER